MVQQARFLFSYKQTPAPNNLPFPKGKYPKASAERSTELTPKSQSNGGRV